jgi:hypothetical protein
VFQKQRADDLRQNGSRIDASKFYGQLWGQPAIPDDQLDEDHKRDAIWASPFSTPPPAVRQDTAQQAAMDRFRALMDPKPMTPMMRPVAPVDPNMQELPAYNPVGYSYTPLKVNAAKPIGLQPLPGITPRPLSETIPKKSPLDPKLPPWMSKEPPVPGTQTRVF